MSSSSAASQNQSSHNPSSRSGSGSVISPRGKGNTLTNAPLFTPSMQSAQARNKNPYEEDWSDDSEDGSQARGVEFFSYSHESYEAIQRRREAAVVLDSPELLMMHAQARNDSIPGTRYYFTKMFCGYLDETEAYEKKVAEREREKEEREAAKARAKGKARGAKGNRREGGGERQGMVDEGGEVE